jgi:hypothetical protein
MVSGGGRNNCASDGVALTANSEAREMIVAHRNEGAMFTSQRAGSLARSDHLKWNTGGADAAVDAT